MPSARGDKIQLRDKETKGQQYRGRSAKEEKGQTLFWDSLVCERLYPLRGYGQA
ncbi:MAG: hypothetical protein LBC41_13365 [Clostridiales bacterium]|nr:hypothetical protein [Clostridiales bacterium]